MLCALDKIMSDYNLLKNMGRIGLVINQTSTSSHYYSAAEVIYNAALKTTGTKVTAIFGPQHGYAQTEQDNMKETPDSVFEFSDGTEVPLYSLYSETRMPTAEQLSNVDTLVVDLQDIGCRVYTYMLTLAGCLRSAAQFAKKVDVLDRNNPLGLCYFSSEHKRWMRVEGNKLQSRFHSFVGWYEIPMRHGLSMGELGKYFIHCDKLNVEYQVIPVDGLARNSYINKEQIAPWTMPSPNIPSFLSAFLFPAFVSLEGTNVSEGRGTTIPFQLIGSPWLDTRQCIRFLEENKNIFTVNPKVQTGLVFREHDFRPTFNKHMGKICRGIQFHIENPENINLFKLGLCFLYFCNVFHVNDFKWSEPGYEYNFKDLPINLILGDDGFSNLFKNSQVKRTGQDLTRSLNDEKYMEKFTNLVKISEEESQTFTEEAVNYFIYDKA
ncbi:MAG: DUF1343 domain-containing protein [Bdellovibrionota bacterium]